MKKAKKYFGFLDEFELFRARKVVNQILSRSDYRYLSYISAREFNLRAVLNTLKLAGFTIRSIVKRRTLVFQFPPPAEEILPIWLAIIFSKSPVAVVHDLDHLRNIVNRGLRLVNDSNGFKMLRKCRLISHNPAMTQYLRSEGFNVVSELMVFDYATNSEDLKKEFYIEVIEPTFVFAGNLSSAKSSFVQELNSDFGEFLLFGKTNSERVASATNYKGVFESDCPPRIVGPCFGLVWDGESIDDLKGVFGEYLKINSPFKVSLYLAMGLPLLVHKTSALSDWVETMDIGVSIHRLQDIPSTISYDLWLRQSRQVHHLRERLTKGNMLASLFVEL